MTTVPIELPPDIHAALESACSRGDELAADGCFDEAIAEYNGALVLIPEPWTNWEAATWVFSAIADACFLAGYGALACDALEQVMRCPGAVGNPFIHLRYGQVLYDKGETEHAADELIRAYMGGGAEIFDGEDSKYREFLETRARLQ